MKYFKIKGGDLVEITDSEDLRDEEGTLHPWNVFDCWSELELQAKGFYSFQESQLPLEMVETAPPFYYLVQGRIIETVSWAPVEIPQAPPAPPAPPPPVHFPDDHFLKFLENAGQEPTDEMKNLAKRLFVSNLKQTDIFSFAGLVVRRMELLERGHCHQGHRHHYDHVTQLVKGSITVEIRPHPPRLFEAPANIPIRADEWHLITAMEDNVVYYCTYRLPDGINGELVPADSEIFSGVPYSEEEATEQFKLLIKTCVDCESSCSVNEKE